MCYSLSFDLLSLQNIICAKEYYFPQYLRNAKRFLGEYFDLDGLLKYVDNKEAQWSALLAGEVVSGSRCYCEGPESSEVPSTTTTQSPLMKRRYRDPIIKFALS